MVKEQGASDLHISTGAPPMLRIHGEIHPIEYPELEGEQARQLLYELLEPEQKSQFHRDRDIDFGYEVAGEVRVRCNLYEQIKGISGAFRLLPSQIYTIDQLGLPEQVKRFCDLEKGLVVVTALPEAERAPRWPPCSTTSTRTSASTSSPSRTRSSTCIRI
jgi:twitching motility protein PilT